MNRYESKISRLTDIKTYLENIEEETLGYASSVKTVDVELIRSFFMLQPKQINFLIKLIKGKGGLMIATRSAMNPIYLQTNASLDMIFDIFKFDVQKNLNLIKGPNSGLSPAAIHILTSPIKTRFFIPKDPQAYPNEIRKKVSHKIKTSDSKKMYPPSSSIPFHNIKK